MTQAEQIEEFADKLTIIDTHLWNLKHETEYLLARLARHHKTAVSTHSRAFWYYSVVFWAIVASSVAQVCIGPCWCWLQLPVCINFWSGTVLAVCQGSMMLH